MGRPGVESRSLPRTAGLQPGHQGLRISTRSTPSRSKTSTTWIRPSAKRVRSSIQRLPKFSNDVIQELIDLGAGKIVLPVNEQLLSRLLRTWKRKAKMNDLGKRVLRQRFKARNDIEQLFVDAALTEAVEFAVEVFEQFLDVLFCSLHRGQSAGILAGK